MKQTLEEDFKTWCDGRNSYDKLDVLNFGAKWQKKQMYSEKEVIKIITERDNYLMTPNTKSLKEFLTPKEWFKQFKK